MTNHIDPITTDALAFAACQRYGWRPTGGYCKPIPSNNPHGTFQLFVGSNYAATIELGEGAIHDRVIFDRSERGAYEDALLNYR